MTESYLVQHRSIRQQRIRTFLNRRASWQPKTTHPPAQLNTAVKITIGAAPLSWLPSGFRMFLWQAAVGRGVPGGCLSFGGPCPFTYAPLRKKILAPGPILVPRVASRLSADPPLQWLKRLKCSRAPGWKSPAPSSQATFPAPGTHNFKSSLGFFAVWTHQGIIMGNTHNYTHTSYVYV